MRIFDKELKNELHLTEEELKKGFLDEGEYITKKTETIPQDGEMIEVEREYSERVYIFFPDENNEVEE